LAGKGQEGKVKSKIQNTKYKINSQRPKEETAKENIIWHRSFLGLALAACLFYYFAVYFVFVFFLFYFSYSIHS
jgi:hypothetical protein